MILATTLTLALVAPQLRVEPERAVVGDELVLRVDRPEIEVTVELPDGAREVVGTTAADGVVLFVPESPGPHVFRAVVDGVDLVAPCRVAPATSRWLVAAACVPLGLALLWRGLSRARDRRAP